MDCAICIHVNANNDPEQINNAGEQRMSNYLAA